MPRSSSARTYKEAQSFKVVNSRHRAIFFKVEVKNYDAYPLVKDLLEALEFAAVLDESTLWTPWMRFQRRLSITIFCRTRRPDFSATCRIVYSYSFDPPPLVTCREVTCREVK